MYPSQQQQEPFFPVVGLLNIFFVFPASQLGRVQAEPTQGSAAGSGTIITIGPIWTHPPLPSKEKVMRRITRGVFDLAVAASIVAPARGLSLRPRGFGRRDFRDGLSHQLGPPPITITTATGRPATRLGVRKSRVAEVDVVESARLYFSSSSVRKHIVGDRRRDGSFFRVVIPSEIRGWRSQAKLAVSPASTWNRSSGCKIGLYRRGSHEVVPIPDCAAHHPAINRAVDAVMRATTKVRTPAYQEITGEGLLRYVQCQVELTTGKVCLTLVMNAEKFKDAQPHLSYLVKELKRRDPKLWHSIWCHCNDSGGNAIFARDVSRWHQTDGPPYVRENIPGSDPNEKEGLLYFSPLVFRQANLMGFHEIAREVCEAIPGGSKVCELYAGVGLLGLSALLHHGKLAGANGDGRLGLGFLRCSDENPSNVKCFERAVASMPKHITGRTPRSFQKKGNKNQRRRGKKGPKGGGGGDEISLGDLMASIESGGGGGDRYESNPKDRVTYMQASASSALHRGQALGADVIIVDPPRKGLDDGVLDQLCRPVNPDQMYAERPGLISGLPRHAVNYANDARTLIYVSCGFDALARDTDRLVGSGAGWKLESATGYVLFPGSNHVETVVVFRR
ncbi:hypothetical protein THAOC_32095 [Thalassiosira oceanica]|uniref:Uncharacterized protein n=1 Tax=Thalassiosira oceanica TaxID=159749 RepID=K0R9Z3_THAOC|nr:hypothetical protein THAOC_32095 [Thalassiosira oceanica]|eukprot:EJK49064.1 hypothetical protein THAOC_32095 [Thalassiosira oceanica]